MLALLVFLIYFIGLLLKSMYWWAAGVFVLGVIYFVLRGSQWD